MSEQAFQALYKRLNKAQKEAVDSVEGPVMVIAGPGTGKTEILTLRIANILKQTDTEPENILALTFTESGRIAMRRRLAEIIGSPAYGVNITTFHSFCNDIIQTYPEEFPHIIGGEPITEVDQIRVIEEIVRKLPFEILKPLGDPLYYVRNIETAFGTLKREGVDVEQFKTITDEEEKHFRKRDDLYHEKGPHKGKIKGECIREEKEIQKHKELAEMYAEYQKTLQREKRYDFSDMIMETLQTLQKNENLLRILQERYQYVLVDEHQDTNNAQNKILELLLGFHTNPNIFVVGDEKQAIFRFQGASLQNFLYFKNLYPEANIVALEENYRSQQTILDGAESVIPGEKKLRAETANAPEKIKIAACANLETEENFVRESVREHIRKGVQPEEIAVLYRENKDAFPFADMLRKEGIPLRIESDEDILEDRDIQKLILLLRTIEELGDETRLGEALHIDFMGIPPLDVYKLLKNARESRMGLFEAMRKADAKAYESPKRIQKTYRALERWKRMSKNHPIGYFLEKVMEESGYIESLIQKKEREEKIGKLRTFFNEIKKFLEAHKKASLKDLLEHLETVQNHNILVRRGTSAGGKGRVRLLTAHRSKGLEFEYVYITRAYDGHWGNKKRPNSLPLPKKVFARETRELESEEKNEDERRLFYVALTRAKKNVCISYPKENIEGRELLPTQFIEEIRNELKEKKEITPQENANLTSFSWVGKKNNKEKKESEKEYLKELFNRQGLSVTALNNYLACPWKYFYTNLLRIPKLPKNHQMYGIAIHEALKDFIDALPERENKELLIGRFEWHLGREPLSEDFEVWEKRGREALGGYFDAYKGAWTKNTQTEMYIRGILLDDVKLTGKLDKVEFVDDAGGVHVTDYKTGKPKSRNEIEGKTKTSDGGMKRQLVFYKLLLNGYKNGKYKMKAGEIDFVEPNDRGKYKKEIFEIEEKEVKELEECIRKSAEEIQNLAFWDTVCEDTKCEFCRLRHLMQ